MIYLINCFPNVTVKQWCVFLTSFTAVMIILICSTDLRNRPYIQFNTTYIWDFEDYSQESPRLIQLIRTEFIQSSPVTNTSLRDLSKRSKLILKPSLQLLKIFKKKKYGIYLELGANRDLDTKPSETEWLSTKLEWRGLLTQPHPEVYRGILKMAGPKIYTAQVCISPTIYVKHALFKTGGDANTTLIPVPCFPLYSLIKAFNATCLDLLMLNKVNAPLQVLKTLPMAAVQVQAIGLINRALEMDQDISADSQIEDLCCTKDLARLLEARGYKRNFLCPLPANTDTCYYLSAKKSLGCL